MDRIIATVSQLNNFVKRTFDANPAFSDIWIKGEISNLKKHISGHFYLTLKDDGGVLKAVMFKSNTTSLTFTPEDGMNVLAHGRVGVYEQGGVYQLYITEMLPDGVGELYLAYERLKKRLEEKGLFDKSHKKEIPKYPEKVGVVTASTGAAVRDIINVITRRYPYAEIILYPTLVQGAGAAESICSGIEYFNKNNACDTLIIGRGGGSIEDLWAFNEEMVAYAIYNSKIPIISAVGHEVDFTISDFVADLRAPTPSAAAEVCVPSTIELTSKINNYKNSIITNIKNKIENYRLYLNGLTPVSPADTLKNNMIRLDMVTKELENTQKNIIKNSNDNFLRLTAMLDALSPLKVLTRGFSIAISKEGEIIKSVKTLDKKKEFNLKLSDGERCCVIRGKE